MKFYNPDTDQHFDVPQSWPNSARIDQIEEIEEKRTGELADLSREYADIYGMRDLPIEERKRMVAEKPELAVRSMQYGKLSRRILTRAEKRICQASLVTRNLPPDELALVTSDVDGPFWSEQDLGEVQEYGARFQAACSAGRRSNRVDKNVENSAPAAAEIVGATAGPETGGAPAKGFV